LSSHCSSAAPGRFRCACWGPADRVHRSGVARPRPSACSLGQSAGQHETHARHLHRRGVPVRTTPAHLRPGQRIARAFRTDRCSRPAGRRSVERDHGRGRPRLGWSRAGVARRIEDRPSDRGCGRPGFQSWGVIVAWPATCSSLQQGWDHESWKGSRGTCAPTAYRSGLDRCGRARGCLETVIRAGLAEFGPSSW